MSFLQNVMASVNERGTLVVFAVATILLIIAAVVYIVYRMKRSNLKSTDIIDAPKRLFNMGSPFTYDAMRMPATSNGQEFSFSMWLYINDFTTTADHKLIFMRGGSPDSIGRATPIVFMDAQTNKLYVSVRTNQSPSLTSLANVLDRATSRYITGYIEYVPLQRWINLTFVVHDNLLTLYLDGDIYTVENLADFNVPGSPRPVFAGLQGNATVGAIPGTNSTQGFVSKINFYNYALTLRDVQSVYEVGPTAVNGVLSRLGLPPYRVRSPVYRADQEEGDSD